MKKSAVVLLLTIHASTLFAANNKPETPAQIRRILAQSICLSVAYPGTQIAKDSESVFAVYATMLTVKAPLKARQAVEQLAVTTNPAALTPVGEYNLALAKCSLFAERADVLTILGAPRSK
jgi:hypothetical protein